MAIVGTALYVRVGSAYGYTPVLYFRNLSVKRQTTSPGSVGIGVTTPTSNFHLATGSTFDLGTTKTSWNDSGITAATVKASGINVNGTTTGPDANGYYTFAVNAGWTGGAFVYLPSSMVNGATYQVSITMRSSFATAPQIVISDNSSKNFIVATLTGTGTTYTSTVVVTTSAQLMFGLVNPTGSMTFQFKDLSIMRLDTSLPGNVVLGPYQATSNALLQVYNGNGSYTSGPTVSISDSYPDNGYYGMLNLTRQGTTTDGKSHIAFIKNGLTVLGMGFYPTVGNATFGIVPSFSAMSSNLGLWITATGNVGIGMTNPKYKLDVSNGVIRATYGFTSWNTTFNYYAGNPTWNPGDPSNWPIAAGVFLATFTGGAHLGGNAVRGVFLVYHSMWQAGNNNYCRIVQLTTPDHMWGAGITDGGIAFSFNSPSAQDVYINFLRLSA